MRRAALALLLVAPTLALAQTITIVESYDQDQIVNVKECTGAVSDQLSFVWTPSSTSLTGSYDLLASDQAGCPTPTSNTTTTAHTITIASGVTNTNATNVISAPSLLNQLAISCPGPATAVNFCVFASGQQNTGGGIYGTGTTALATGSLQLDLQTPPPPNVDPVTGVMPGDSALTVSWTQGTGSADAGTSGAAASYNVYCDVHPATSPIAKKCATVTGAGTTSARVTGLQNGTEYDVEVTALSIGGNESDHSTAVSGVPVEVLDFWRLYRSDGGRDQGGCATGAAGLAALVALAPLALRRRRRRA